MGDNLYRDTGTTNGLLGQSSCIRHVLGLVHTFTELSNKGYALWTNGISGIWLFMISKKQQDALALVHEELWWQSWPWMQKPECVFKLRSFLDI